MSGIPAHTNQPGTFSLVENRPWQRVTQSGGPRGFNKDFESAYDTQGYSMTPVAWSRKPPPYPGDRASAYGYFRAVSRAYVDRPRVIHERSSDRPASAGRWTDKVTRLTLQSVHGFRHGEYDATNVLQNARMESVVEAYNDLEKTKSQIGAEIGQAKQTLGMIASTATDIAKALSAARRGRWGEIPYLLGMNKRAVLSGKYPANKWLEYQYGWKPLFGTLHSLTEQYLQGLKTKEVIVSGHGFGRFSGNTSFLHGNTRQRFSAEGRVKTVLLGSVEFSKLHGLDSMGLLNPASIAWELVPFSFVVDWFIPVGAVLESYSAKFGLRSIGGWSSIHTDYQTVIRGIERYGDWEHPASGAFRRTIDIGEYSYKSYLFSRIAYTDWPGIGLYANVQPFKSLTRCANAAALVRQLLR